MNERKGSMSQQTFAILVANFLGLVIVLSSPVRPRPLKNSRCVLDRSKKLRRGPDFYSFVEHFIASAPRPGANNLSYSSAIIQRIYTYRSNCKINPQSTRDELAFFFIINSSKSVDAVANR